MDDWDAQKMLDKYILDYMVRKNMHTTAEIFAKEAEVSPDPAAVDPPDGFLTEWWSLFWDVYNAKTPNQPEGPNHSSGKNVGSSSQRPDMTHMPPNVGPPLPRPDMSFMPPSVRPPLATSRLPDFAQNVYPTTIIRPDMGSMLQNALPTMMSRPDLNFNGRGRPPMMASAKGQGPPPATDWIYGNLSEQERLRLSARDLNPNARLLNADQLANLPPFSINSGYLQNRAPQRPQAPVLITGRPAPYLGGSSAGQAAPNEALKLKQPATEHDDAGKGKGKAHVSSGGWLSRQDSISYSAGQLVGKQTLTTLGGPALVDDGSDGNNSQSGQIATGVDPMDDSFIDSFFSNEDLPNDMDPSFYTSPQRSVSRGEFQPKDN